MALAKTTPKSSKAISRRRKWPEKFLIALSKTANVGAACRAASVDRTQPYSLRKKDPLFAEAWEAALDAALDVMEEECRRRGFEGFERDVYHNGEVVGKERHFSDTLAIFLLKAHRPMKFRERYSFTDETPASDPKQQADAIMALLGWNRAAPTPPSGV